MTKTMGVDFDATRFCFVVVDGDGAVVESGKLALAHPRNASAVRQFAAELKELLHTVAPKTIAIKAKPENGQMRAGAPALKMEGLLLAHSACEVIFVPPVRVAKEEAAEGLFAYLADASRAARIVAAGWRPKAGSQ